MVRTGDLKLFACNLGPREVNASSVKSCGSSHQRGRVATNGSEGRKESSRNIAVAAFVRCSSAALENAQRGQDG